MPTYFSPEGNGEFHDVKPAGYFTEEEWYAENPPRTALNADEQVARDAKLAAALVLLRTKKKQQVDQLIADYQQENFSWSGLDFYVDIQSMSRDIIPKHSLVAAGSVASSFEWVTATRLNDVSVRYTFTVEDFKAFCAALGERNEQEYFRGKNLKDQLDIMDLQGVEAFDVKAEWDLLG